MYLPHVLRMAGGVPFRLAAVGPQFYVVGKYSKVRAKRIQAVEGLWGTAISSKEVLYELDE